MRLGTARILTGTYFVLMMVFVTWPGMVPFARVRPLVLGLPFSFFWIALWIAGSVLALWGLDRVEGRHRGTTGGSSGAGAARPAVNGSPREGGS